MLSSYIDKHSIKVNGILHIGANYCQEQDAYETLTSNDNIFWIEADPRIVNAIRKQRPSINIFNALITDKDDELVDFHISNNNGLSSSVFQFDKHLINHPTIHMVETIKLSTMKLDTFVEKELKQYKVPNVLVIDVQGAEVLVLKGATKLLNSVDLILTEVNNDYTYKNCGLIGEIDSILKEHNFTKIFERIWDNHTYGDAIYLRNNRDD